MIKNILFVNAEIHYSYYWDSWFNCEKEISEIIEVDEISMDKIKDFLIEKHKNFRGIGGKNFNILEHKNWSYKIKINNINFLKEEELK